MVAWVWVYTSSSAKRDLVRLVRREGHADERVCVYTVFPAYFIIILVGSFDGWYYVFSVVTRPGRS